MNIIDQLNNDIAYHTERIAWNNKVLGMLAVCARQLTSDCQINAAGFSVWITIAQRDDPQVLMQLAPRWDKSANTDSVDYSATVNDIPIKLIATANALPPTCRLVEEEVVIPAEPARPERKEKRMVVRCEPVKDQTAVLSVVLAATETATATGADNDVPF